MQQREVVPHHSSRLVNRSPIFYGWVILAAGSLGMILTSPGQTYSFSIFIEHFIADLGISRSLVSTLYTVGTLTASFALPMVGRQLDRRGGRVMVVVVTLLFGLATLYMGSVQNALMLGIGFVLMRMLGQGSLSLVCKTVMNQWWVRRRGLIMGISGMISALLGSGSFPNLINWLISRYGWRGTYWILGVALWAIMLPVGWIFFRSRPEDYGLQPDGHGERGNKAPGWLSLFDRKVENPSLSPLEDNWTRKEAMGTRVFWVTLLGLAAISMLGTGLTFHVVSIFQDSGLTAGVAAAVFLPTAATSAVVQLVGGLLVDRLPVRVLLAFCLVLQAVTLVMAPYLFSVEVALFYGVLSGIGNGLQAIIHSVVWANYFGRQHLGSITGVVTTVLVAASALGPMPMGVARDLLGSYTAVLTVMAILPLILAGANLVWGQPPRR